MKISKPSTSFGRASLGVYCFQIFFALLITVMPSMTEKAYAAVPSPMYLLKFNYDFYDYSRNERHGVPGATATIITDPTRGKVLNLNGTANTSVVTIQNTLPASYTKAAWVKFGTTNNGSYSILSNGTTPSSSPDFFWVSTGTYGGSAILGLKAGPITAGNNAVWSTGAFPTNTWTHVAVTFDGSTKQYRLYQSGVLVGLATGTSSHASTAQAIGAYATTPSANTFNWTGQLDDVQLWDSVLTEAQIGEVMNQNNGDGVTPAVPDFPTSLEAFAYDANAVYLTWTGVGATPVVTDYQIEYKINTGSTWNVFSDSVSTSTTGLVTGLINNLVYDFRVSAINASGTGLPSTVVSGTAVPLPEPQFLLRFEDTYDDVSSHANHGTATGAIAIVTDGIRGKVARFIGSIGNYVTVNVPLGTTGFTKAAWIYIPVGTTMSARNIISNSPYGGSNSSFLWVDSSKLQVGHFSGAAAPIFAADPANMTSGSWAHVAVTYQPALKKYMLYRNGALVASGYSIQNPNPSTGTIIGAYNTTAVTFSGFMDDVEMWNSALTPAQIQLVYEGNTGVPVGVPVAPANFTGTTASSNKATLIWSGVSAILPVTDYQIEYKISTGSTWTVFSDGVNTGTSVVVTGLTTNLSYDFRVAAVNSAGTGAVTNVVSLSPIVVSVPQPQFLLGFEGNYEDMSINRNNGIATGTLPIITDGTRGKVVNINGVVGNYVGLNASLNVSGFTKAAWVYVVPGTNVAARNILSNGSYGGSSSNFLVLDAGVLKVGHFSGASIAYYASDSVAFGSGQWIHVATTYNSTTKKYMLYRNGALIASGTAVTDPFASTGTTVGAFNITAVTWSGYVDNAEMWDSTLTPTQVQAVYEGNLGVPEDVPYVPLNFYSPSVSTGVVNLIWSGVTSLLPVTDYQIEYKISTGSTWTVFSDGVSANTTGAVTGLIDNLSYDFRVAAVNSAGTGSYSTVATAAPGLFIFYHILSNGQSISVGYNSTPALSLRQPYNNLALGGGDPFSSGGLLGPLIESGVESPSAGLANALRAYSGTLSRPIIIGLHGLGATYYSDIKKGTAQYAKGMAQAALSKSLVEAAGGVYRPLGVTIEHGEFDARAGNFMLYESYLVEWQRDYQFDINALMGTTGVVFPMFLDQEQSSRTGGVAVAQLNAHRNNPGKIFLVGPKYQYSYGSDNLHLTNTGSKFLGEMLAKVMYKVAIQGQTWNPLMPTSVIRTGGNAILVSFNIPVGTLNIDTGSVAARQNYGFEYYQSGGTATTISGVRLLSGNTMVEITLSGGFDGTGQKLRYAWTCGFPVVTGQWGHCANASSGLFVGGNIRDSDSSISPSVDGTGLPLYNWLVTFDESIITPSVPNAPTNVTAVASSGQAIISFSGSTNSGGAAITEYVVVSSPGSITFTGTGSPITVTGLTNGVSYTFAVAAKNYVGTGTFSSASNPVVPATIPTAPTNVAATASSGQAVVEFSGSSSSGWSTILYYIATSSPGNISFTGTGSPITVTGLTNGVSYTFTVEAYNAIGTGEISSPSNAVVPATVPNAPINVAATASSGQAVVAFSGSTNSGGSEILYYVATSTPGNISFTGTGSPITVTGLTNGVSYTFTVAAVNAIGAGATGLSNAVIPATVPGAPTAVSATSSSGQAIVSFTAPANNGGTGILYYIATSSPGNISFTGTGSPIAVTGLTNGVSYTFTVEAYNAVGTGAASSASNAVIPATVPTAPTNATAVAGSGQAIISFSGSTNSGGSQILYYIVTSSPGSISLTGSESPITITGLTNGVSYTFTVIAVNAIGTSSASSASNAVVPVTLPGAPTGVNATGGNAQATISFTPPASNGGTGIVEYIVTSNPGNIIFTGTESPITVTGLTNGVSYTFTVVARNRVGSGDASAVSNAVIPATVANAPTNVAATSSSGQAIVSFSGSTDSGGSAILYYIVTSSTGNIVVTGADSPITVAGLTNGVTYAFTVSAYNAVGTGTASSASNDVMPITVPTAPINVSATGGNQQATIRFTGSINNGGTGILYYVATSNPGNISFTGTGSPITVTGLTNGVSYTFTVAAINGAGTGVLSSSSNAVIPATVANAPTNIIATASSGQAVVSFSGSSDDGGSTILYYVATSNPGNISFTGTGTPIIIEGLTNGVSYTFTVAARNAVGTGAASAASSSVTPVTMPGVPSNIQGAGTLGEAIFDFDAPVYSGGSALLYYTIRSSTGQLAKTGVNSPMTLTGLTNGVTYTFFIAAVNAQGEGTSGAVTFTVTTPTTIPSEPTNITAIAGSGSALLSFSTPTDNGGLLIDYYAIRSSTGALIKTGANSPIRMTGLQNGISYAFSVSAVNGEGEGPSDTVTIEPIALIVNGGSISVILGSTSMIANWTTTIRASTQIQYGITTGYTLQNTERDVSNRVTLHSGNIQGLLTCTNYNYRIIGSDDEGYRYTGTNSTFTTLGCPNNAPILTQEEEIVEVPVGGVFTMTSTLGTTLELIIPEDVVLIIPTLLFQGKQLEASTAIGSLGKPSSELIQVSALYDLQAYSGDTDRMTTFETGLTMTLSYRDQDVSGVDESTLKIYSHDGTSWSELDNCVVDTVNKNVTCNTSHFSAFSIFGVALGVTPSSPSVGGGGGGVYLTKDVCPNGDYSLSYYDKTCSSVGLPNIEQGILRLALNKCTAQNGEEQQSYCFNRAIGSTTMPTFMQARYYDQITRAQLSKIMGEFAKNILGKTPDKSKQCTFTGEDPDGLAAYMIQACQLGLMNTSRPNDILTRGEYMTVLSRMLYGKTHEQTNVESEEHPFYEYHMEQLYKEGLINRKEPLVKAQRLVPFLTLYRLAQKLEKESR